MKNIGKIMIYLIMIITSLFIILPLIFTFIGSFSAYWGVKNLFYGFTLQWYKQIIASYGQTIVFTLVIAISTVIINIFLGTMSAYSFYDAKSRGFKLLEEILTLPVAVPGIAIALALIQTQAFFRASGALILIGHIIVTFPIMFRGVLGSLRSKDFKRIRECAVSLGAGNFYTFFKVILPSIKTTILSGAIMVFLLSLGEFNITFFLYTPLKMTMPVGLYEAYATLRIEIGSAFTVIFLIIALPMMYILHKLNKSEALLRNGGV